VGTRIPGKENPTQLIRPRPRADEYGMKLQRNENGWGCREPRWRGLRLSGSAYLDTQSGPFCGYKADTYGRRPAYANDGLSIDVLLIGEGLAKAWTRDGQHRQTLIDLEQSARENRAGCLWG
jgi:hypothetical protein